MLDSIFIGMSGLLGHSAGLRVISDNSANMNTPGFKESQIRFADLCNPQEMVTENGVVNQQVGAGLKTTGTSLIFKQGEIRETGNDLDAAVNGLGLFILKDADGKISYSRAGQFQFDEHGILVTKDSAASHVMGFSNGALTEISLDGLRSNPGKATALVKFNGNLSSTATDNTVSAIKILDALGKEHQVDLKFTNTNATTPGSWRVDLMENSVVVGTSQIIFQNGAPTAATAKLTINYTPAGSATLPVTFDFSTDVTSYAAGNLSSLAVATQDGYKPGALTKVTFDASGHLQLSYANGQSATGTALALGMFQSIDGLRSVGGNRFESVEGYAWQFGEAGTDLFGTIKAGNIEISNVDLSQQFSDLVIMQRGYQASSQIISTANEMLQQLFTMKGK